MITIELDAKNRSELERIFQGHSNQSIDDISKTVARLAFEDWMGWLSGTVRHTSLTDQSIERISSLYAQLMPGIEPDVNFLYNRFNIPYGRAKYIVQVLSERQLRELRVMAQKQLLEELKKAKNEVEKTGGAISKVEIQINRRGGKILLSAVQEMVTDKKEVTLTEVHSPLPDIRKYTLSPEDVDPVLEKVEGLKL